MWAIVCRHSGACETKNEPAAQTACRGYSLYSVPFSRPCGTESDNRNTTQDLHPGLLSIAPAGLVAESETAYGCRIAPAIIGCPFGASKARTGPRHKQRAVATRLCDPCGVGLNFAPCSGGVAPGYHRLPLRGKQSKNRPTAQTACRGYSLVRPLRGRAEFCTLFLHSVPGAETTPMCRFAPASLCCPFRASKSKVLRTTLVRNPGYTVFTIGVDQRALRKTNLSG